MKYYLGPWVWKDDKALSHWQAPAGAIQNIDLRPIHDHENNGVGLFVTPDDVALDSEYRLFGRGHGATDIIPVEADRSIFASMVGAPTVDGTSFAEWMYTLMTLYADQTGDNTVRPLMPTSQGLIGVCGIQRRFALDMPEAANVIAMLQADYRSIRADALEGRLNDDRHHLRVLDSWCEKYGVQSGDIFIPPDLPKEGRIPHSTTRLDDFDRADGALGTATVASVSQGWSWSLLEGTISIFSNKAASALDELSNARADGDLSGSDHYAQAICNGNDVVAGVYPGVNFRKDSSSTLTFYHARANINAGNVVSLFSFTAGTGTLLLSVSQSTPTNTQITIKGQANGSAIGLYANGSQVAGSPVTDTSITSGLRCGLRGFTSVTATFQNWDDFEAADLAAGGALNPGRLMMLGVS